MPRIRKDFSVGVEKFVEWIESIKTVAIAKGFRYYITIGCTPTTDTCPILLLEGDRTGAAFQSQGDIGWKNILEVKILLDFKLVFETGQHGWFRCTVTVWTVIMSSQLLELNHKM